MPRVTMFRVQDLFRDEQQFLEAQALMKAERRTDRFTKMTWAEFQGTASVGGYIQAKAAKVDKRH